MTGQKKAPFDFSSRDSARRAEEGAELEVLDPVSGEGVGAFITLAGADSAAYRNALNAASRRRGKTSRGRTFDPDRLLAESAEILAACTLDWKGVLVDGERLPCSRENAVKLYIRFPWLREQAEAFIADRAAYLRD